MQPHQVTFQIEILAYELRSWLKTIHFAQRACDYMCSVDTILSATVYKALAFLSSHRGLANFRAHSPPPSETKKCKKENTEKWRTTKEEA